MLAPAVAWVIGSVAPAAAPATPPVRLLAGFERDQALAWGAKPADDAKSTATVLQVGRVKFRGGDATEGEFALVRPCGAVAKATRYNVIRRGAILNTHGAFAKRFPRDWSGYATLRADVKSTRAAGRVRVEIEDDLCQPTVRRTFDLPAGKWVTVEFDLAGAAKRHEIPLPPAQARRLGAKALSARVLNLARMANIFIYAERLDGATELLLDNLRLLAPGAAERVATPVVRDESPWPLPLPLPETRPRPPRPPARAAAAGRAAPETIDIDLSSARKTCYARVGGLTARALAVGDGRHMLLGFLAGYMHVVRTTDGGKTWAGLDGRPAPTRCYHNANAPSHTAVADGADMLYAYTDHCAGGGNPSNLFFRRLSFTGKGWSLGTPRLLDLDCRHCPEWKVRLLRLAGGRIWAAWMHLDRTGKLAIRARYSDDAGLTWRDPDSNAMAIVDRDQSQGPQRYGVTLWVDAPPALATPPIDQANGRVDAMYAHGSLAITPHGDGVACLYARTWHPKSYWRVFDGGRWGEARLIGTGVPGSAVTVGRKTIYITFGHRKRHKVLRLDGEKWVDDTPPGYAGGGRLSVAGERVLCFWAKREGDSGKFALMMADKRRGGGWSAARTLATETLAGERPRLGVTVPRAVRGNFVPLAWGPHHEWIRFRRVPLAEEKAK